jgi:hypothetical protein
MKVIMTNHAKERMIERNITKAMIMTALQKGTRTRDDRVEFKFDNNRSTMMVGVKVATNKLIIKTVFIRGRLDNGVK